MILKKTDEDGIEENRLETQGSQSKLHHSIPNYTLTTAFSIYTLLLTFFGHS